MNEVNWGIIGVGNVTEVKSGPAFNKVEYSNLVMVMRRNLDKARDYAQRHSVPHYTNDADDLLNNPEINAIYVATPPSSHAEYTIRAAKAKKHVYVEKPMATRHIECLNMISACQENGVHLFVAYYRRAMTYFNKVKQLIDKHEIGEIKHVDIKLLLPPNKQDYEKDNLPWRVIPEFAGAGYFYDLASHQFDLLDYLFGPISSAKGHHTNQLKLYPAEDIVSASFLFDTNNIMGSGTWCFTMHESYRLDRTEILGSKGKISFSFFEPTPIELITPERNESFSIDYPQHVQQQLIESVVGHLLSEQECVSTGSSAARTNLILEKILS